MKEFANEEFKEKMRITFDYNYAMKEYLGSDNTVSSADIDDYTEECAQVIRDIKKEREEGKLPFMDLPYASEEVLEIKQLAKKVRYMCDDFVVLGIGGSALGMTALMQALKGPFHNAQNDDDRDAPRLYVADNIDPDFFKGILDNIDSYRTIFNVISKSGSTAETMSQFMIAQQFLKDNLGAGYKDSMIATTDAKSGILRDIVNQEELSSLIVPDGVGGRFSVLSAVGLFPAAVVGIDIDALLAGARFMDEMCQNEDVRKNPAALSALIYYLYYQKGRNINVMMPYSSALKDVADWYGQIWAESLGKRHDLEGDVVNAGQTPVKALGVTDQHSQLQLYVEGPDDKVITFIKVGEFDNEVRIPEAYSGISGIDYLGGTTLTRLINSELHATEITLMKNSKPNCTINVPAVNAFTLGQLLYMLEVQTSVMGKLMDINTYDQPGVEQGKLYTYGMMGREGFEDKNEEIESEKKRVDKFKV